MDTTVHPFIYQYKDHVGNVRLSYKQKPNGLLEVVKANDYYPFGMRHNKDEVIMPSTIAEKRMYNGMEFQDELQINWYDYMARNYDPAIGRWFNTDPLAEKSRRFSPYVYALNNPVYFVDPDGMEATASEVDMVDLNANLEINVKPESDDTFKLDKTGNITKIDDKKYFDSKGIEVDKLIEGDAKYDEKGNLENKSIDVKKGVLSNQKSLTTTDQKGNVVKGYSLDFGNNYGNAKKTFEFISSYSDVEFTFLSSSSGGNISNNNELFTSHLEAKEHFGGITALSYARRGQLTEHNHNHPLWSAGIPSPSDSKMKSTINEKTNIYKSIYPKEKVNETKFNIYFGGQYYPY